MDTYVIMYGSKWGWKYTTGVVQKLCKTKEEAIEYAKAQARISQTDVYVEQPDGKFKKLKM